MKKQLLLFSILCLFVTSFSQAQTQIGAGVLIGVPQGDYAKNEKSVGGGIDIHFAAPFGPRIPVYFGVDFGYNALARRTINETLKADIKIGNTILETLEIPLQLTISNNLTQLYPFLRFKAPLTVVKPYVDVMGGFKYFFTRVKLEENQNDASNRILTKNNPDGDNIIASSTPHKDFILSYGGAFGVQIGKGNIALDLRAAYLLSGETEYFTKDDLKSQGISIEFTGGSKDVYDAAKGNGTLDKNSFESGDLGVTKTSRTDMLFITAGVVFSF